MASELCMNCFSVKGQYEVCPFCGYVEGTPPAQPHYLTPGTILGNHFIVGTAIGFGGFGITYKCFDTTLGVTVAAKEFYPIGLVNRSPGEKRLGLLSGEKRELYKVQLNRFLMEARSVAQFGKAKDIVNIYDFFEENGTAYIIMEYIDGVLLKDYIEKNGALSPNVALSVIMPIIEAVKKIHSKGIIHRDISPDNIFIVDENTVKIFDFGAAQLNDSKEGMAGENVIKVGYSAPEQYRDKSRQSFYTDVYSVGAILYQLLTGIKPIESTEREYKDEMKSPMELGIKISSNVDRAVMEALAVQPELRFQGMQQFEDALRNKRAAEYPKDKIRNRKRKRNWMIGAAVAGVLAVGVGIALFSTVLKPSNVIFESEITQDTNVTIWVENDDQKDQWDDLINNGFLQGELSLEDQRNPEQWEKFWSENEKVDVDIVVHEDIQKDLKSVPEEEKPNMYITDHVDDSGKTNLLSLEDVYTGLNIEEYAYMSEYTTHFPSYDEMPTGLDTLLVYICNVEYKKENTLLQMSGVMPIEDSDAEYKTVELDTLISNNSAQYTVDDNDITHLSNKLASFDQTVIADALVLKNMEKWNPYFNLDTKEISEIDTLVGIQGFNNKVHSSDYNIRLKNENEIELTNISGNNTVAGVSYRNIMENSVSNDMNGTTESLERNILTPPYQTYVVTHNNKMLVEYSERYGITDISSEQQELACKRLLYLMLQKRAQSKKNSYSSETTFPIRNEQLEEFASIRSNMKDFVNMYKEEYPCVIIGETTGNMYEFSENLNNTSDKDKLQQYCDEFSNSIQK